MLKFAVLLGQLYCSTTVLHWQLQFYETGFSCLLLAADVTENWTEVRNNNKKEVGTGKAESVNMQKV